MRCTVLIPDDVLQEGDREAWISVPVTGHRCHKAALLQIQYLDIICNISIEVRDVLAALHPVDPLVWSSLDRNLVNTAYILVLHLFLATALSLFEMLLIQWVTVAAD